jgi:hypothetical protein
MDRGYKETHSRREMLKYIKCELSSTLVVIVDVGQHISEKTHKLNALKFWIKVCYQKSLVWLFLAYYVDQT